MSVLYINSTISENSRTDRLCRYFLKRYGSYDELKLTDSWIKSLDCKTLEKREDCCGRRDFSDDMFAPAKQFKNADVVVIGAPYYDLSFPSLLKTYIENILVRNLTFRVDATGRPVGMTKINELVYITTSGGPIIRNMGFQYVSAIATDFFGIEKISFYCAENLDIDGADTERILENAAAKMAQ